MFHAGKKDPRNPNQAIPQHADVPRKAGTELRGADLKKNGDVAWAAQEVSEDLLQCCLFGLKGMRCSYLCQMSQGFWAPRRGWERCSMWRFSRLF